MAVIQWRSTVSSFAFSLIFALSGVAAEAASKIGVASAVKNRVEGTVENRTRPLAPGSDVFAREVVRTGDNSTAQLLFLDETSLAIGPQSEVTLDRFVFDPNRGAGNVVIDLGRGALRFATGSQQPNSYRIRTTVATIGVRGTLFDVYRGENAQGLPVLILILIEGISTIEINGQIYELSVSGDALFVTPPGIVQQVTWESRLLHVTDGISFPAFGRTQFAEPYRVELPDGPIHSIDQLIGTGGPPSQQIPPIP